MSDQTIHLTLSRADAEFIRDGLDQENREHGLYPGLARLLSHLNGALYEHDEALSAPAEGPERAATGETALDWEDIDNAIAARLAADDARDAAIGGGGEGESA